MTLTANPGHLLCGRQLGYLVEATIVLALASQLNLILIDIKLSDGSLNSPVYELVFLCLFLTFPWS